jgi:hypothetical protein
MKQVNIGGVPEHFNLAWYLTLKNGEIKPKVSIYVGKIVQKAQALCVKHSVIKT